MALLHGNSLDAAIADLFGQKLRITNKQPVYGGDINDSYCLTCSDGSKLFVKCNTRRNLPFFEAEAKGLEALRATGTIGVPEALAIGTDGERSFLLMEYLDAAPKQPRYWEVFGRELAQMHLAEVTVDMNGSFGFPTDNYIGASVQKNTPTERWIDFYRDCRLLPQIRMAAKYFDSETNQRAEKLLGRLDTLLAEPKTPSLLHGDLWSGNAVCGPDGKAWILDPAVYVGHFEAELAMTELFGGYPDSFYAAYHEVNPIERDYRERKDLYNLYHLLNHLNLFGVSYLRSVQRILDRYAS